MKLIVEKKRIDYNDYYCLIVPDMAAGLKYRYTVYRITASPRKKSIKIIGRELDLPLAKKVARKVNKNKVE